MESSALGNILPQPKFQFALRRFGKDSRISVLDIGCGNHSPSVTKRVFPQCHYSGVDIGDYNMGPEDKACMDKFYLVTPDGAGYQHIPDGQFDLIICNHVIEHMIDPYPVLRLLTQKLTKNGVIRLAFPSEKSLRLPTAVGTLNFSDDNTHVHVPEVRELSNLFLKEGLRIIYAGPTRDRTRWVLGFFASTYQSLRALAGLPRQARGTWIFYGFEDCVIAERP